ncbi:MAG: hypothetical protein AAGE92_07420 [Cyanobacteria bacterium P01_G01_bin.4]
MTSQPFIDRLPAWVFWPLFVALLASSVGSAVGLYLLNSSSESIPPHEQAPHEQDRHEQL